MSLAQRIYSFYTRLKCPPLPAGVDVMNPYAEPKARGYVRSFLNKYFDDDRSRVLVFGINPARFGAGLTGITFTDPVALADFCGVPNSLARRRELSSEFIYQFIHSMGGVDDFYRRFFLTAISPLGYTRGGVNLNYYDDKRLARAVTPFIVASIERQIALGGRRDRAIVLGAGTNRRFFEELNREHGFFDSIDALDHPRFIMQYRRKRLGEYLVRYAETFKPERRIESASRVSQRP